MTDMFREIQEEIQRERYLVLWQRYGKFVIGAAIAVVLFTIIFQMYRSYENSKNTEYTNALLEAVRKPGAGEFAKVANETKGVQSDIARLIHAQLLMVEKKDAEAVQELKKVADSSADEFPKQLVQAILADQKTLPRKDSAFYLTGLERSGWAAVEAKDYSAAEKAFTSIETSENAVDSMKERAKSALAFIQSVKPVASPDKKS